MNEREIEPAQDTHRRCEPPLGCVLSAHRVQDGDGGVDEHGQERRRETRVPGPVNPPGLFGPEWTADQDQQPEEDADLSCPRVPERCDLR